MYGTLGRAEWLVAVATCAACVCTHVHSLTRAWVSARGFGLRADVHSCEPRVLLWRYTWSCYGVAPQSPPRLVSEIIKRISRMQGVSGRLSASCRKGNREVEPVNITVVLCTYNRCDSLAKALESVAQSAEPASVQWEVLIVDNNA